ncbi:MAG: S8 family serine peptidase [candidate division Zixibacteria bacterium]|nr:S8 family serine peptidase [candidate division Zixibacteria bacterium]
MKQFLILVTVVLISLASKGFAGDSYYYLYGEQKQLIVATDKITIIPSTPSFDDWEGLYTDYSGLDPEIPVQSIPGAGAYLFHLQSACDADSLLSELRSDARVAIACPVYGDEAGRDIYVGRRLFVKFFPTRVASIDSLLTISGLRRVRAVFHDNTALLVELHDQHPLDPVTVSNRLYESGLIEGVGPDFVFPFDPFFVPNDIDYPAQYNLDSMDLPLVWELTIPNSPVLVGVLDDGVEAHEDIASNSWADGYDYLYNSDDESPKDCDYCYHGMAVCGLLAALTNNDSTGVAGIAGRPGVRILAHRVFRKVSPFTAADFATSGSIMEALQDAVDSGAAVINISWGMLSSNGPECPNLYNIDCGLNYAHANGVLVVCGSGNACGTPPYYCSPEAYPACYPTTFAVGALDALDTLAEFSQYGDSLDLVAYGEYIPTTDRMGDYGIVPSQRGSDNQPICELDVNYDCIFGGTSAAAAQVTATAALIFQRRSDLIGQLDLVEQILRYSAENPYSPVEDTARISDQIGWGRVNAFRALLAVIRGDGNNDGFIGIGDAVYIAHAVFQTGPPITPDQRIGDANCDGVVNVGDAVYIVNYIFYGGPAPSICFSY